jgi:21S rRNA (uridine2791-2'-O)-methyltransferase
VLGIDIIPTHPPKGVSTMQGDFLDPSVQSKVLDFLNNPLNGILREDDVAVDDEDYDNKAFDTIEQSDKSYMEMHRSIGAVEDESDPRLVNVVLSDMSAPWPQTSGFYNNSLSDPYRMMNTSGIAFRDHAGSMVQFTLKKKGEFLS